jgi:hypothetical protein
MSTKKLIFLANVDENENPLAPLNATNAGLLQNYKIFLTKINVLWACPQLSLGNTKNNNKKLQNCLEKNRSSVMRYLEFLDTIDTQKKNVENKRNMCRDALQSVVGCLENFIA